MTDSLKILVVALLLGIVFGLIVDALIGDRAGFITFVVFLVIGVIAALDIGGTKDRLLRKR